MITRRLPAFLPALLVALTFVSRLGAADAYVAPDLPRIPDRTFDIRDYGATGDGTTDNTRAVQSAIAAAARAGGGRVEIPAGVFLCGPLTLENHVALHLAANATLRMLPLDRYPGKTESPEDFISAKGKHDLAVAGPGTIDGQGSPWWPFARVAGAKRPRMLALGACERILIEGVTLKDSPMFHIAISGHSTEVTVRGVVIRAPASDDPVNPSHNTDACDVSGRHVLIQDCDVSVGDDNFTCGGQTADVLITHCTYGYGHGVSIGSHTAGGVENITVRDCTFTHTECGIRIKSDRDRGGVVQNLVYENLTMTDVACPILIYGAYMAKERQYRNLNALSPETATAYPAAPLGARTPVFRHLLFRNITATAKPGKRAGLIWGLPEAKASDVRLENVRITADLPFGVFNAEQVRLVDTTIITPPGVAPLVTANAQVEISPPPAAPVR